MKAGMREEDRQTEDDVARGKLGPRGVPGAPDTAKMTPQEDMNIPKSGEFDVMLPSCGMLDFSRKRPHAGPQAPSHKGTYRMVKQSKLLKIAKKAEKKAAKKAKKGKTKVDRSAVPTRSPFFT